MTKFPLLPPAAIITASKKGGTGKTHLMTTVADLLTLNGYPYSVFQADDKRRLGKMLGARVVDLRPNPDLVMNDPALVRKAFTPFYTACQAATATGNSVLFDIGADEVENTANFLTDGEIDEDLVHPPRNLRVDHRDARLVVCQGADRANRRVERPVRQLRGPDADELLARRRDVDGLVGGIARPRRGCAFCSRAR